MIWNILYAFCSLGVTEAGREPGSLTTRLGVPKECMHACDAIKKEREIMQAC
jgi:hypothetical protein